MAGHGYGDHPPILTDFMLKGFYETRLGVAGLGAAWRGRAWRGKARHGEARLGRARRGMAMGTTPYHHYLGGYDD